MKNKVVTLFSIFLICIFCIQLLLPLISVISIGIIKDIQKEKIIRNKSNENLLEKFILNQQEFKNLHFIDKKEFVLNNILYDISEIKFENGHFTIFALQDNLEYFLKKLNNSDLIKYVLYIKKSMQIFSMLYFENLSKSSLYTLKSICKLMNFENVSIKNPFMETPYPPPKVF
jgi:hypothetical protein